MHGAIGGLGSFVNEGGVSSSAQVGLPLTDGDVSGTKPTNIHCNRMLRKLKINARAFEIGLSQIVNGHVLAIVPGIKGGPKALRDLREMFNLLQGVVLWLSIELHNEAFVRVSPRPGGIIGASKHIPEPRGGDPIINKSVFLRLGALNRQIITKRKLEEK